MQSYNYVQGVSGWKMHSNGTLEVNGKIRAIMVEQVDKPETPFAVQDGQVFLHKASIGAAALDPVLGVRTFVNAAGQTVFAGIGAGLCCMCEGEDASSPGDKVEKAEVKIDFSADVSKGLDQLRTELSETRMGESLAAKIEHEVTARASAGTQLSARIGALEIHAAHVNEMLDRLLDCVSQLIAKATAK